MRSFLLPFVLSPLLLAAGGCPGDEHGTPDAACSLDVAIGSGSADAFEPISEGDDAEVVLGFQGFRMLIVTMRLERTADDRAEVSGLVSVDDGAVEVGQLPRTVRLREGSDGARYAEELLLFFNETPISVIVDRPADLELVARSGGCVGGTRVRVVLRDDDDCVDYGVEVDAGTLDGGVPDGSVACGDAP